MDSRHAHRHAAFFWCSSKLWIHFASTSRHSSSPDAHGCLENNGAIPRQHKDAVLSIVPRQSSCRHASQESTVIVVFGTMGEKKKESETQRVDVRMKHIGRTRTKPAGEAYIPAHSAKNKTIQPGNENLEPRQSGPS